MRILTCDEVRQAALQVASGPQVSTLLLKQRAGYAAAQFCLAHFKFRSVCVVCGESEIGGAGLAAAQALSRVSEDVFVMLLATALGELNPDAQALSSQLAAGPIWLGDEAGFESEAVQQALAADLIIDAIAGCGSPLPLDGLALRAVRAINDVSGTVVSLDLPAGVDGDGKAPMLENASDLVFAHGIVTFVAPKPAHVFGELTSGPVAVSELGVQPALVSNQTRLEVVTAQEVGITFPPRTGDSHKGDFGHVLVIAGSRGKAGAAGLAGMAALCAGAGLVTVACPESIQQTVAGFAPELMTEGLPETDSGTIALDAAGKMDSLLAGKDAIVLGPGISGNHQTAEYVRNLVAGCRLPLVLDADGLNAFAGHYGELKPRGDAAPFRVLTPHPGEAARLTGTTIKDVQADRVGVARHISRETGSCAVLKGWRTIISGASGETWINMTGNPAMAKGGAGDVLSGIIGAALARRRETSSAFLHDLHVAAAVYLHGLTGDLSRDILHENTVLATDLLENLAEAFRDCESQIERGLFYLHK
ncbi:MAG: NAD(P)H-hydrate dehydratase [Acidobacteriia bacterium]|nr:NAD(P)H-hydrate dehydratase [Terriglobia bacterium]